MSRILIDLPKFTTKPASDVAPGNIFLNDGEIFLLKIESEPGELPNTSILLGKQYRSVRPAAVRLMFPHGRTDETTVEVVIWANSLAALKAFSQGILVEIEKIQTEDR